MNVAKPRIYRSRLYGVEVTGTTGFHSTAYSIESQAGASSPHALVVGLNPCI